MIHRYDLLYTKLVAVLVSPDHVFTYHVFTYEPFTRSGDYLPVNRECAAPRESFESIVANPIVLQLIRRSSRA